MFNLFGRRTVKIILDGQLLVQWSTHGKLLEVDLVTSLGKQSMSTIAGLTLTLDGKRVYPLERSTPNSGT